MLTASCSTLPAAFVTKLMVPNARFVPMFRTIATPMVAMKSTGSNQLVVVSSKIRNTSGSAMAITIFS